MKLEIEYICEETKPTMFLQFSWLVMNVRKAILINMWRMHIWWMILRGETEEVRKKKVDLQPWLPSLSLGICISSSIFNNTRIGASMKNILLQILGSRDHSSFFQLPKLCLTSNISPFGLSLLLLKLKIESTVAK